MGTDAAPLPHAPPAITAPRWRGAGASWLCAALCSAAAIALYWPILEAQFVWDDAVLIVGNAAGLDEWADAGRAFAAPVLTKGNVGYYRPVLMASFVADRQLWGDAPRGFHRTDLALHALNAALLWALLFAFVRDRAAATAGALLFAVHPIQAQAVALILGRNDLLLCLPFAAALLLYPAWRRAHGTRRAALHGALVALYAVALWTKETGIMLPAVLLAADRLLIRDAPRDRRALLGLGASCVAVTAAYALARWLIFGAAAAGAQYTALAPLERLRLVVAVLGYYIQHIALPVRLAPTAFHPRLADPTSNDFLLAALVCAGYALLVGAALRRRAPAAFGLVAFAVALLPVLGVVPMKLYILEHRVYVPMIGIACTVAAGLGARTAARRWLLPLAFALVAGLAVATAQRVPMFRDSLSLWSAAVHNAPETAYARHEYGFALVQAGRDREAMVQFREALRLDPNFHLARYKLALALERHNRRGEAIALLERQIEQRPRDVDALNALGVFLQREGQLERAEAVLRRGLAIDPDHAMLLANLAETQAARTRQLGDAGAH